MAQLNDTLVNGDLRVNGKIYGIITSADSATNASNLGSTAASDFALKNGNYSSNGLVAKSASTAATANAAKWTEKSDNRTYNVAFSLDNAFNYRNTLTFNPSSNTLSSTNINTVTLSGTTVKGATVSGTTVYGNTISAGKLTGTQFILVDGSATKSSVTAADKAAVNALDNPKIGFYNVGDDQKGYIIWTDYNNSNIWGNADSSFFGGTNITDGFVVTSDQLNSIFVSKNLSATNFKGVTISGTNITAATTVRGTNLSGTNISGASKTASIDNLINSASRAIPTVNNKTITITTGASPATASFTTNTAADKTITLGSMALKASGDYLSTSWNNTTSTFNGSANSALTAKYASGAGSASKAVNDNYGNAINASSYLPKSWSGAAASLFSGKAVSAVNAANLYVAEHSTNNTTYYPIWANGAGNSVRGIYTTTAKLQFNPASGQLYISNIVKVGGCSMIWNASTSALDFNF